MAHAEKAEDKTIASINRVVEINPKINAVIAINPRALEDARAIDRKGNKEKQILFGEPILIKDNIETKGRLATTAGSLALKDNVTGRDAPLVAKLRDAGAVILGKANLSEWANFRSENSVSGWSAMVGQTRNPYALNRSPCGSSSGSAAAVSAGIVDMAIGTETNGSIICPAAMTGIVGFKPTVGLVSRRHIVPISHSQDTAGPMTRTVRKAARIMTAIAGSDPGDPATKEADKHATDFTIGLNAEALKGVRLGVMRFASGFGTDAVFQKALENLESAGAELVEIKEFERSETLGKNGYLVLLSEFRHGIDQYLKTLPPTAATNLGSRDLAGLIQFNQTNAKQEMPVFDQSIFEKSATSPSLDDPEYLEARKESLMATGRDGIDKLLKLHKVQALVGPSVAPAFLLDSVHGDTWHGGGFGDYAAVAGYPHLTVPMDMVKGLPVGLSFIGPKWSDAKILEYGYAYEKIRANIPLPDFVTSLEEERLKQIPSGDIETD